MTTVIQIKRSANVTAPTTADLVEGELAYSYDKSNNGAGAKLYIEVQDSGGAELIHEIGGKYYTDLVDNATNSNTASTIVKRDASGNFSANVITANEFVGNITGTIEGEAASAVIANTANALTTGRYINLTGDVVGSAYFDGTGNADISSIVIQANSVALGTDTTGDYVSNVLAGTGIAVTGQGGETATPTVALTSTGVTANTYGGTTDIPVITVDAQGRITAAANAGVGSLVTPSSITTFTNKTYDVSVGANNKFSIQGNDITSYSGSGSVVLLQNTPTLNGFNIRDSDLTVDGGTGTYWAGQSGVAQTGDLKAGVYATDASANNSLFTFGTNGSNTMSVGVEGSLFIGTARPSNNGGLNTAYSGWLVVQSGGKFGGDIDTLGGLNLTDATNGKIVFSDGSTQREAYTSNHLTTANVVEVTNLYFTNARARAAITTGNTILYDSSTGNITLSVSGVSASTYGGGTKIPTFTVDQYGRVTAASNVDVSTSITLGADSGTADPLANGDTLRILGGTGIDTTVTDNTITVALETSGVTANTYGGASKIPVLTIDATGRVTAASNVSVAGVSSFTASGNTFTIATADGGSFSASIQENSVRLGTDTTGDYVKNVLASTGIVVSGAPGESRDATIALENTAVSPSTYGGADKVSVFTVDQQGRLTAASNVTISIPASALNTDVALGAGTSGDYVANLTAGTGIGITNGTGETSQPTITNTGVVSLTGTSNEVTVSAANGSVQIGLPDDVTIGNNLTVTGDLVVNGNALTVNTVTVTVEDPLVKFGNANPADSLDIGFYGQYTSSGDKYAGLFRDASDTGKFKLFVDLTTDPTTNVINTANYTVATLVSNLTGGTVSGLTANIAVSDGGTGRGTLTTNSILYGQGTSAVGMATGSAGQVLQLNGSGVPVFGGIDGGSY